MNTILQTLGLSGSTSPSVDATKFAGRKFIAEDTIARSSLITASTPGASDSSVFHSSQLPALDQSQCPRVKADIKFTNCDAFKVARQTLRNYPEEQGKVAVLNLASDEIPGGGWIESLCTTQEEALCYSSTLYSTLSPDYYPWPNTGPRSIAGVYSPAVVVFKDDLAHNCVELPEDQRKIVGVITVAAPRWPRLTEDNLDFKNPSVLVDLREKIKLVYRMAASNGKTSIILGAMGCGAYGCPPQLVAAEMRSILLDDEFAGWFKHVAFAIFTKHDRSVGKKKGNFEVFEEVFAAE